MRTAISFQITQISVERVTDFWVEITLFAERALCLVFVQRDFPRAHQALLLKI